MELLTYWESLFNDSVNPCSISDLETDTIVFMNLAMKKMLQEFGDYTEQKCYELMHGRQERCSFCPNERLEFAIIEETYIYNKKLDQYFRVNHTLLEYYGQKYNLCKYFLAPTFDQQQLDYEEAMHTCEKIVLEEEIEQIPRFLELIGKFYNAEKAHIYRIDKKQQTHTYECAWAKSENAVMHPELSELVPAEHLFQWETEKNEMGMIEGNRLLHDYDENSFQAHMLNTFNLNNVLFCHVGDGIVTPKRTVGLSNRKSPEADYRLLKAVSELINHVGNSQELIRVLDYVKDYDVLTGFYSRESYSKKVQELQGKRLKSLGVLYISVNGWRKTIESHGTTKGDSQVRRCSEILSAHFGKEFYRISTSGFVGFFGDITEELCLDQIQNLRTKFKADDFFPFTMGHCVHTGNFNVESMVKEAQIMMYINKQRYYYKERLEENPSTNNLLNDLLRNLNDGEFMVYLQPQVDLQTDEVIGAEALIRRFDKKNQQMVFPDEFISLYEQESIIRHVDIFVLREVCRMLAEWKKRDRQIPISVNLSRVTLLEFDIVNTIADICDEYEIDHHLIIIEVTERVGLIENDVASSLILEFREKGFKISLDDFGCAYSNIVTLAKIEVNEVKIDKSLIDDLTSSEKSQLIVGNVLHICNSFQDTHTLAEGIETILQAEILKDYGCTYGQGYLYSRPISSEDFYLKYIATNT
ncbi:MAG: bifunctional diguanylate cyclase/phosphodiesterase [Eubacteriales bacterium]